MKRRTFLSALLTAAGTVLIDKSAVAQALLPANEWKYLKFTDPRPMMDSHLLVSHLIGQRTDGKWFYVIIPETAEEVGHPHIHKSHMDNARWTLDTFLNCACVEGTPCEEHKRMFGEHEDGEYDDVVHGEEADW